METKIIKINRNEIGENELDEASRILRAGGLVAFPTETVYGLGGNALDPEASKKIYAAKGRPSDNPLIVHIAEVSDILKLACDIPGSAWKLAERFWPGPMTMILRKRDTVPRETTGGLDTVAIRLPSDEIARALIRTSGVFIAAPSANSSGRPSPTTAAHVIEDLSGKIDMIIDGGKCDIGLESSIIDLTGESPLILRPGFITREDFEEVLPGAEYDKAVIAKTPQSNVVAKAPGMKYRHYAPKGMITIVEGDRERVIPFINDEVRKKQADGLETAVICSDETCNLYSADHVYSLGSREHDRDIAASLFAVLRMLDEDNAAVIYSESFEELKLSQAIMNRLRKAAGYNTVRI